MEQLSILLLNWLKYRNACLLAELGFFQAVCRDDTFLYIAWPDGWIYRYPVGGWRRDRSWERWTDSDNSSVVKMAVSDDGVLLAVLLHDRRKGQLASAIYERGVFRRTVWHEGVRPEEVRRLVFYERSLILWRKTGDYLQLAAA